MPISLNGFFWLLRHRLFPVQFSLFLLVFGFGRYSYRARELFIPGCSSACCLSSWRSPLSPLSSPSTPEGTFFNASTMLGLFPRCLRPLQNSRQSFPRLRPCELPLLAQMKKGGPKAALLHLL